MKRSGLVSGVAALAAMLVLAACGSTPVHTVTETKTVSRVKTVTVAKTPTRATDPRRSCDASPTAGCVPTSGDGCPAGLSNAYAASRYAPCETPSTASTTATAPTLDCDQGAYRGTLVGGDTCEYDLSDQEVVGPVGAYLRSYSNDGSVCNTGTADWSNDQQTSVPAEDPTAPQCSGQ